MENSGVGDEDGGRYTAMSLWKYSATIERMPAEREIATCLGALHSHLNWLKLDMFEVLSACVLFDRMAMMAMMASRRIEVDASFWRLAHFECFRPIRIIM